MGSALVRLRLKQRRKDQDLIKRRREGEDEEEDEGLIKKRRKYEYEAPILHSGTKGDGTAPRINGIRYFSFQELKHCTHNFSKKNEIGESFFGKVYKGCCSNGVIVAITQVTKGSFPSTEKFQSEIEVLSRVHHKSIVRLLGFCSEQGEQLLVFEYMTKGSLFHNLHGEGGAHLDWRKRLQIALDSARALAYLHELANPLLVHGGLRSANVLLDENLNAKVTDFCLSRTVSEKEKGHDSSKDTGTLALLEVDTIGGTSGYLAPEYLGNRLLSEKTDVYAFGVVMLELLTARRPFDKYEDTRMFLGEKVKSTIDENDQDYYGLRDMIDPKIVNQVTIVGLRKFVQLALKCLQEFASNRPSMSEIMKEIDII